MNDKTRKMYRCEIIRLLKKLIEQNEEIRKLKRENEIYKKLFIKEVMDEL